MESSAFDYLDAPVERICGADIPMPCAPPRPAPRAPFCLRLAGVQARGQETQSSGAPRYHSAAAGAAAGRRARGSSRGGRAPRVLLLFSRARRAVPPDPTELDAKHREDGRPTARRELAAGGARPPLIDARARADLIPCLAFSCPCARPPLVSVCPRVCVQVRREHRAQRRAVLPQRGERLQPGPQPLRLKEPLAESYSYGFETVGGKKRHY